MKKEENKTLFEKYNSPEDIVSCPLRYRKWRKLLNTYGIAAVNLYGIISLEDFVEIFNQFFKADLTADVVKAILLPFVFKHRRFGFYQHYLVHYVVLDDIEWVDYLFQEQGGKPRYIPEKDAFAQYVNEVYEETDNWETVFQYLLNKFGDTVETFTAFFEVRNYVLGSIDLREITETIEKSGFKFDDEKQLSEFIDMLIKAKNNTRMWEHKGYTPVEMMEMIKNGEPVVSDLFATVDYDPEEECHCGSGAKYKKCCMLVEQWDNNHLTKKEKDFFYNLWLQLLDFVNRKYKVTESVINVANPLDNDPKVLRKVRDKLWENTDVITEFVYNTPSLSFEERKYLHDWEYNSIKGAFVIFQQTEDYAILVRMFGIEKEFFGIKGISASVSAVVKESLPMMTYTVLLPFGNKIIYDGFLDKYPLSFKTTAQKRIITGYQEMLDRLGIVTDLTEY